MAEGTGEGAERGRCSGLEVGKSGGVGDVRHEDHSLGS